MELNALFKSLIDQDEMPIVICDLDHTMVYLNPVAKAYYRKYSTDELCGKSVMFCHPPAAQKAIERVVDYFRADSRHNIVYTYRGEDKDVYMVALRDEEGRLIGYYEKHRCRSRDTAPLYDMR